MKSILLLLIKLSSETNIYGTHFTFFLPLPPTNTKAHKSVFLILKTNKPSDTSAPHLASRWGLSTPLRCKTHPLQAHCFIISLYIWPNYQEEAPLGGCDWLKHVWSGCEKRKKGKQNHATTAHLWLKSVNFNVTYTDGKLPLTRVIIHSCSRCLATAAFYFCGIPFAIVWPNDCLIKSNNK